MSLRRHSLGLPAPAPTMSRVMAEVRPGGAIRASRRFSERSSRSDALDRRPRRSSCRPLPAPPNPVATGTTGPSDRGLLVTPP